MCLQHCRGIFDCTEPDMSSDVNIQLQTPFDFVSKALSDLRDKMENMSKAIGQISETSKMLNLLKCLFDWMFDCI